ncbi:hypothetical protein BSPWISOXPB_11381 [uncultured Gammaproteobacteria bacterium]|nr:hypothetical protein BSPWISOXPB_11381 [uncultured Gammaproteobacteria bacterium]
MSRLNEVTLSIIINNNTQDFTTKYEYDESSRIKTITYPDGFTEHKDYTLSGGAKKSLCLKTMFGIMTTFLRKVLGKNCY